MISLPTSNTYFSVQDVFSVRSLFFALGAWSGYLICLGIYRLYFDPLAKFPGPKLADNKSFMLIVLVALTTWYQAYYDVWRRGRYLWRIKEMHDQYGPIVRINPHELHINDPEYIDDIYSGPSKIRDKYRWISRMSGVTDSFHATLPHELHRRRRAPLNPYFSKANVRKFAPVVQNCAKKLMARIEASRRAGEVIPLSLAYQATTSDIITEYSFGNSTNNLDQEDYNVLFHETHQGFLEVIPLLLHIGWLGPFLHSLPIPIALRLSPGMGGLFKMQEDWALQIDQIRNSENLENERGTIFHGILNSDLPEAEKTTARLRDEAHVLVIAGQDTTATTLASITYHLLANPAIVKKLRDELITAIPDPDQAPTYAQVEHLPYLLAIVQEGLRMHPAVCSRLQRVSPIEALHYPNFKNPKWTIPAGVPVSMTPTLIQTNPEIFPFPNEFRPERWLENPSLTRYLLSFSRGTRNCIGINLAYQEIFVVLASIFRKYDVYKGDDETEKQSGPTLALYDTKRERDVDLVADLFVSGIAVGSKGIQVIAR